jgi:hypothetical protein
MTSRHSRMRTAILLTCLANAAGAQQAADTRLYLASERLARVIATEPIQAARGWQTFGEVTKGRCIEATVKSFPGSLFNSQLFYVETRQQYQRVMTLSVSASGKYYTVGGSAAYNLSKSLTLDNQSFNLSGYQVHIESTDIAIEPGQDAPDLAPVMRAYLEDPSLVSAQLVSGEIPAVRLSAEALALLKQSPKKFLEQCGDSYISAVSYGGEQVAALVLQTKSREEKRSVAQSFSATAGSSIGATAAVSKTDTVRKYSDTKQLRIYLSETGAGAAAAAVDLTTFQTRIKQFQESAATRFATNKTPLFVTLRRYDLLPNWPEDMKIPSAWEAGPFLANAEEDLESLRSTIEAILSAPKLYVFDAAINQDSLRSAQAAVERELSAVRNARESCVPTPSMCMVDGRWSDDYAIRTSLPALRSDVANWTSLQKQKAALARSIREYRKFVRNKNNITFTKRDCPAVGLAKSLCMNYLGEINHRKKKVAGQEEAVRIQAAVARIQTWVRSIDSMRCSDNVRHWGCVGIQQVTAYENSALSKQPMQPSSVLLLAANEPEFAEDASEKAPTPVDTGALENFLKEAESAGTVTVDCSCKTKANPSWCETDMGSFNTVSWAQNPFKPEDADWDAPFLAEYCRRHADNSCLCPDVKYFEGKER